ncbi:MAG: glycosyltransferase [Bacteroidota bacterium]
MHSPKRILVAPLNWGLGHATRCMPIIDSLLALGHTPILASDGYALELLRKEYPQVEHVELPSYRITYAKKGKHFKLKMIWDSPKMLKAISREKKAVKHLVRELRLDGIISDNRLGVRSKKVPSVFITHQLNVLTGNTTWMSSKVHQKIIRKFEECWVPDVAENPNLSGKLGHLKNPSLKVKYLGPLSRLQIREVPLCFDLMVLLSGPEPQRSLLEEKLLMELQGFQGRILFVAGRIEDIQKSKTSLTEYATLTYYNYMQAKELEMALNESRLVLSRSGYTTIMDLAKLGKKAFFIPTPGQYEQKYLAKELDKNGWVPYCKQEDFELAQLNRVDSYSGLSQPGGQLSFSELFSVFSRVKENSEPTSSTLST